MQREQEGVRVEGDRERITTSCLAVIEYGIIQGLDSCTRKKRGKIRSDIWIELKKYKKVRKDTNRNKVLTVLSHYEIWYLYQHKNTCVNTIESVRMKCLTYVQSCKISVKIRNKYIRKELDTEQICKKTAKHRWSLSGNLSGIGECRDTQKLQAKREKKDDNRGDAGNICTVGTSVMNK